MSPTETPPTVPNLPELLSRLEGAERENARQTECIFVDHRGNKVRTSAAAYQEIRWLREQAGIEE